MFRPSRYTILVGAAFAALLAAALFLRLKTPPAAARLLPESDAIVYANLRPFRAATHFDQSPVTRSPEFQQFIDATGIVPERDLNAAAFALHRMDNPNGPNGPVGYSEVFEGQFDGERLARYLATIATSRETYAGHVIFTIPVGEAIPGMARRNLRVAQIADDTITASNMPTTEQIHAMLDRRQTVLNPFSGSSLLSGLYGEVPLLSSGWAIGQIGLPFSEGGSITLLGLRLSLAETTPFIASLRYLGSVRLRVEGFTPGEANATQTAQLLTSALALLQSIGGNDASMHQLLSSLHIATEKDRIVLTVNIPVALLRHLARPDNQAPPSSPPASH